MQHFSCELTFLDLARELAIPVEIRSSRCRKYPLAVKNCIGIIDTGATSSMLTETIARELDLIPSGNITVSGVHGTENANMYEVDIIFGNCCILRDMPVSGANGDAGFDLLIGMDRANVRNMTRIAGGDPDGKIRMLLSHEVADPWYTGNFDETWRDVVEGCTALLKELNP